MKTVKWTDSCGLVHAALVRDDDPSELAPMIGIPLDPPTNKIDLGIILLEVHNALVENKISSWRDVQEHQSILTSTITSVVRKHLVTVFKLQELGDNK